MWMGPIKVETGASRTPATGSRSGSDPVAAAEKEHPLHANTVASPAVRPKPEVLAAVIGSAMEDWVREAGDGASGRPGCARGVHPVPRRHRSDGSPRSGSRVLLRGRRS